MEAIRQNIDMIFYPAIDLKDGVCVRLLRGEMDAATVFNDNPGAQSKAFEDQGAEYLHVVDLNGAFAGKPVNADAVNQILTSIEMPTQLGGGMRSLEPIDSATYTNQTLTTNHAS